MNIVYRCPECADTQRAEFDPAEDTLACGNCSHQLIVDKSAVVPGEGAEVRLNKCLVCPSKELYVRKNFPQRLGVAIVAIGLLASCLAWYNHWIMTTYGILFLTAFIDVALYVFVGEILQCYLCQAQYRGVDSSTDHAGFDLATHEKYRQMSARLKN